MASFHANRQDVQWALKQNSCSKHASLPAPGTVLLGDNVVERYFPLVIWHETLSINTMTSDFGCNYQKRLPQKFFVRDIPRRKIADHDTINNSASEMNITSNGHERRWSAPIDHLPETWPNYQKTKIIRPFGSITLFLFGRLFTGYADIDRQEISHVKSMDHMDLRHAKE